MFFLKVCWKHFQRIKEVLFNLGSTVDSRRKINIKGEIFKIIKKSLMDSFKIEVKRYMLQYFAICKTNINLLIERDCETLD